MALERVAHEAAERCRHCPKMCSYSCPVGHESACEAHTPWAMMSLVSEAVPVRTPAPALPGPLGTLARRALALVEQGPVRPLDADGAEALYACTGCLRCRTACEHATDVPSVLFAARAEAVTLGVAPAGAHATADRIVREGHAMASDPRAGLDSFVPLSDAKSRSVLFAGCEAPLSSPGAIKAALSASRRVGAPLALATSTACCGRALFEGGFRAEFRRHVARAWEELGARDVVVLSAACGRALGEWAREVGVTPKGEVVQVTTHLASRIGTDVKGTPVPGRVTYHDPCHLGRGLGEYEAPRKLLSRALEGGVVESASCRESADCCGAAGLLPATFPEVSRAMSMSRADELRASGASLVATACPSCRRSLSAAGLEVSDVVEIVDRWLGEAPGGTDGDGRNKSDG